MCNKIVAQSLAVSTTTSAVAPRFGKFTVIKTPEMIAFSSMDFDSISKTNFSSPSWHEVKQKSVASSAFSFEKGWT
jgi:hypothetical protein